MKPKFIYIIILVIAIVGIALCLFLKPKYKLSQTITSPNKEYILEVYKQINLSHFGSSSQNAYKLAYVILKDAKGNVIASPNVFKLCRFTIGNLNISWETDKVYFTQKNYININTKTYFCI